MGFFGFGAKGLGPGLDNKQVFSLSLVAERGPTENKTLHSQDFCNKLRTSWSVTLQNSRSFVRTI